VVFYSNAFRIWLNERKEENILAEQLKKSNLNKCSFFMYVSIAEKVLCKKASTEEISLYFKFLEFLDYTKTFSFANIYFTEKNPQTDLLGYMNVLSKVRDPWENYHRHKVFKNLSKELKKLISSNKKN
jgi:hypothetical protein